MRKYRGATGPHMGQQHHVLVLPETLLQTAFEWAQHAERNKYWVLDVGGTQVSLIQLGT
jgi:hypothetical protein